MKDDLEINYRYAHDNDFEQIYAIWQKGIKFTFENFSKPENLKDFFYENFCSRKQQFNFWVSEIDNIIIGWISVLPMSFNPLKKNIYGELSIYFDEKLNRFSSSKFLMDFVLKEISSTQIQFVIAYVLKTNLRADKFFKNIDFKLAGQFPASIKEPFIAKKNIYYKQI